MPLTKRGKTYYADYYDAAGDRQRVSLRTPSRKVAERLLAELVMAASRGRLRLPASTPSAAPLSVHLADYLAHLAAHGGRGGRPASPIHLRDVRGALTRFVDDRRLFSLAQLNRDEAEAWLRDEASRPQLRKGDRAENVGRRTLQKTANALKAWARWLYDRKRTDTHQLLGLQPVLALRAQADVRHARRPLTEPELQRLLPLVPPYRALIWLLMARTGLRVNEVAGLAWGDLELEGDHPRIRLRASVTKNGQAGRQELPLEVARELARWRDGALELGPHYRRLARVREAGRGLRDPVFPAIPTQKTWRRDLAAAGIAYETAAGHADRHSLRMKFGTDLALAGTPVHVVMRLMRHSSVELTLRLYAFVPDAVRRAAVAALGAQPAETGPKPVPESPQVLASTG